MSEKQVSYTNFQLNSSTTVTILTICMAIGTTIGMTIGTTIGMTIGMTIGTTIGMTIGTTIGMTMTILFFSSWFGCDGVHCGQCCTGGGSKIRIMSR